MQNDSENALHRPPHGASRTAPSRPAKRSPNPAVLQVGIASDAVAEPASVEAAAAVFRRAAADGLRVSIDRAGGDIVLSTARLDRILEHEAGDLTATVEAGIRLSVLNQRLVEHGQMLALDPPGDPTVGACLAGNLSGPRRLRYGEPRDLVLGVTLVLADGTIAHSGGKVVKNVAGYDLAKLFCGSHGMLGLVARASLRLHPRPDAARTLAVPAATAQEAARIVRTVRRSTLVPSADEVCGGRVALLFEGSERAVEAQLARARALFGGEEDDGSVWTQALPRAEPAQAPAALIERIRSEFDPQGVLA